MRSIFFWGDLGYWKGVIYRKEKALYPGKNSQCSGALGDFRGVIGNIPATFSEKSPRDTKRKKELGA